MSNKVDKELEARKKRLQAKNDKVDAALEKYKQRKKNNVQSAASDLIKRYKEEESAYNSNIESYDPEYAPSGREALKSDLDKYRQNQLNIDKIKREVDAYRNYFGDSVDVDAIISNLDAMSSGYNRIINKNEYAKTINNWLDLSAETTPETAAARQKIYEANKKRMEEINEILPWYGNSGWVPNFVEDWFLDYDEEELRAEYEKLQSENEIYNNEQLNLDKYYTPVTPEFTANASYRNYTNVSKEDLWKYNTTQNRIEALLRDGNHYYDSKGNIINATTKKVDYAADDLTRAMYKQATSSPTNGGFFDDDESDNYVDQFYNSLVQDKLALFLSASDEDLAKAYSELSSNPSDFNHTWARILQEGDQNAWKLLTEHEINIYYNLYKTKGQAAAYKYLDDMKVTLTKRETTKRQEDIANSSGLERIWLNIESIPKNVVGGAVGFVEDAANVIRGKDVNPYSRAHSWQNDAQYVRQVTAEDIDAATGNIAIPWIDFSFGDAYQAVMSTADSFVGTLIGSKAYGALMGMGAASSTMKDMWEKGATPGQMFAGGLLAGAAEMVFEKYSIDKLVSMGNSKTIKQFLVNGLKQGGVEASEEMLTEVANTITNSIVMGSQSDWVDTETFVKNVLNSGLSGFLSGNTMGGVASAINYGVNKSKFKQTGADIIKQGGTDTLLNLANEVAGVTGDKTLSKYSNKAAVANQQKAGSKKAALEVGRTSALLQDNITEQNRAEIQSALIEKGLDKKDAKRVSEYLASTKELTEEQISEVKGNEKIKAVAKELLGDPESKINERTKTLIAARLGIKYTPSNLSDTATESGEVSLNTEVDVKDKVSADGKTINTSTGETININKDKAIAKTEIVDGERVVYFNTDKGVVSSKDVNYASEREALLYESFVDFNPAFANAVIKNYDGKVPVQTYIKGMREGIVLYGMHNFQGVGKDISKNTFFAELSEADQYFALKLGSAYAESVAKKEGKALRTAIKNAADKAEANKDTSTKATAKKGRVSFEDNVKPQGRLQKRTVALAKHLARAMGIDIVFYDARTTTNENGKGANGYFDEDTNTIHLDLQNSESDAKTIAFTLSHELLHFIKKWSPEKFNTFAKFLMEQYAEHGVNTSALLSNKMAELGTKDADLAYEEMIADACETMLLDSNAVYKLMELRKADLELFEKIKLRIHELLNKIRDMYKKLGLQPTSDEAKALLGMTDVLEQIYSLFEEASVDAVQNYQAALETEAVSVFEDGTIRMQMKQYEQTGRSTLLKYLKEQYGEADANDLISTIDNVYNAMAEIKKDTALSVFGNWQETEVELDENGHPIFTSSINNGDYKLNQDFSRVCKKRRQLDFVLNMLAEDPAFEASNLTKDDIVKINQSIKAHGFEIACALCFVDSKRFRQTEWADSFANTWNDILYSVVDDKSKLTPFNFATQNPNLADDGIEIDTSKSVMYRKWSDGKEDVKNRKNYDSFDSMLEKKANGKFVEGNANVRAIVKILKENPHLRHTFRGADIIGSQGFDTIQRLAPNIRGILDGWGGTSVPKPSSNDAIYDNSVLNIAGYNAKSAFAIGGVRMNSFSDFMAHMFFDYVQAFADLSAKGLPMHSYTKELDFARLFGLTKGKINMSAIAAIRENATDLSKIKKKADKEKATEWEKSIAGLDISKVAEKLGKAEADITYDDVIQNLDDCEYVWADESIDVRSATLLQSGIMYDNLTEGKAAYCYELIKEGKFEEAFKVAGEKNVNRDYAKHLGIITVGVSKAHILKLLRDPTIRMVIPYHKSGLNAQVAAALKIAFYEDFTDVQNTMLMKSDGSTVGLSKDGAKIGDKNISDFNFYKYFGKTIDGVFYDGKATAAKYLEWCENGEYNEDTNEYGYYFTDGSFVTKAELDAKGLSVLPKFGEFANEENYYKLVEDFDCYDTITGEHSPQEAVDFFHDGLPADYKDVLVKALKAEQKVSDDFRDHLDNKGLRDEVMDIVKARGYKPFVKKQVKKALDKDYLDAVNNGDMETAQRMVDEYARISGYTEKVLHGTNRFGFTKIKTSGVEELVAWSPFFATDSIETAGTYSSSQNIKRISDSSMQTDEDREKILKSIQSESIDLAEFCNSKLGIRGWVDYDYFSNKINECVESLENGTKLSKVQEDFVGFCDEIFYTFIDNYYYENYNEAEFTLEAFEESKEYEDLSDKFYDYVYKIEGQFNSFDYESTTGIYDLYANPEGLLEFDAQGKSWNRLPDPREANGESGLTEEFGFEMFKTRDYAEYAKENGYKGVKITNLFDDGGKSVQGQTKPATVYIFFNPQEQVKSADPVTYDNNGKVIPLSQRFNKANDDIRYQKKRPTNRTILSNALESAIDTSTQAGQNELKWLKEYQSKIETIEKEEAHLAEVNAEIKEISFGKNTDRSKLKDLNADKVRTNNRINTYDKQLMRLEAMKPIKDILAREKEMVRKRTEEKGREALANYRREALKVRNQMIGEARRETRQKISESRSRTEMRHKIKKVVSELNQLLLKGNKDKRVMIGLQKAVAEALDAVNMDTVDADNRVAKYNALIAKAKDPDVIASLTETRDRIQAMGDKMSSKLTSLKNAYSEIKNSTDPLIANSYDEVIASSIEHVVEKVGDTPLRAMSIEQLEDVYDLYTMVLTRIRDANKAFKANKGESISTLSNKVMMEVEKVGGSKTHVLGGKLGAALSLVKKFDFNNLKPVYAFERIGSNTLSQIFENVRKGEDVWAVDVTEAKDFKENAASKYNYKKWDFDKVYSFKTSTGTEFSLTLEQIMSLYAYSKREQALPHLAEGGFVFDSNIETYKVKENGKKSVLKYKVNTATAHKVSPFEVADIVGKLTADQKAFVDEMQRYLSDVMGAKGNEVALEMYGVKLFKEKHYFPLKSAKQYMFEQNDVAGEVKIKNSGFSKGTVKHANNPVILSNFMDVWANHVNDMSMYHAFVLPLEDFNRVFNYNTPASQSVNEESVKGFIQNAYGTQANEYISQLIKDLNGGARVDPRESVSKKMIGKFKKASVFGSASVVIQQPSAVGRALALIGAKYFDFNPKLINHNKLWTEVKKYAPVAIIKEMGHFDTDMGASTVDYIKGEKSVMEKVDDVISKPASYMDELTWVHIWTAVKREVKANNKDLSGEAYLQKCGERFTEVVTKTQVYDSVLSRSANMRSKSVFMNMLTSFMAEPTTSINMLEDAMVKFSRGQNGKASRQIASVAASVILNSMLVAFVYAARDDDEDETYWEKYIGSLTSEVIDGSNPITYYPILKDIWSIAQGYDVERSDMTLLSKAFTSLENVIKVMQTDTEDMTEEELAEHNQKIVDAWLGVAGEFSSLVGIPAKNFIRDIKAGFNVYNTANNGAEGSWSLLWDAVAESALETVPIVGWFAKDSKADKLYDAIVNGDTSVINRLKSGYKDDKAYNTAVRKALRENDPRIKEAAEARFNGDMTRYREIAYQIKGEGNFTQDNIVSAIMTEYNTLVSASKDKTTSSKSPTVYNYTDYYNAIIKGDSDDVAAVRDYLIESGKTEEDIESNLNSDIKEAYKNGELSESEAKSLMVSYGGKAEDEADIAIRYVDFKSDYPDYAKTITESRFKNYYEPMEDYYGRSVADTGLSVGAYAEYCEKSAECKGIDADRDGKADSGTKKAEIMKVINSLPITIAQKDALYFLNGWSKKTLFKEAPWR